MVMQTNYIWQTMYSKPYGFYLSFLLQDRCTKSNTMRFEECDSVRLPETVLTVLDNILITFTELFKMRSEEAFQIRVYDVMYYIKNSTLYVITASYNVLICKSILHIAPHIRGDQQTEKRLKLLIWTCAHILYCSKIFLLLLFFFFYRHRAILCLPRLHFFDNTVKTVIKYIYQIYTKYVLLKKKI